MKTRRFQAGRRLAIACAVWTLVTGVGGVLKGGTQAAMTSAATINQPTAMSRTTAFASCTRPEHFRSARCNDMRHFAGEWNQNVIRDRRLAPEIHCDDTRNFRIAKCNDIRHFAPVSR